MFFLRSLFHCIAAGLLAAAAFGAELVPLREFNLPPSRWSPGKFGKITGNMVVVDVPQSARSAMNCAGAEVDLVPFRGQSLCFTIRARAWNVSTPRDTWNGVKFMLNYRDADGQEYWHHPSRLKGTFDWREVSFTCSISPSAQKGTLKLGLQDSSGKVEFDLASLKVYTLFPLVNRDYKVSYPERVASMPLLRGVMSPHKFTDDDLETLHRWNVKLVRAQITRAWGKANTDRDLAEYDRWLDGKLDHLEEVFKKARKYGILFVIDLHSPPGGRDETRDMHMFYDKKYADHFIKVWQRIARRFKGNPSVWAYDLVNEPVQTRPAPYDYWNLQRMAAEAVRRIDPDTPIIIEANEWDSPTAFRYLSPLAMDNVIYQVHMYHPGQFTHQFVGNSYGEQGRRNFVRYPGKIGSEYWDKEMIRKRLQAVRDFQKRHNARIFVGEFSAILWAPGAADYLRDCIEIFEEYGWDWTYHAFREWNGWSLEHEGTPGNIRPSANNDRREVMLKGFRGELKRQ